MKATSILLFSLIAFAFSCETEKPGNALADMHAIENGLLPAVRLEGDSVIAFNILDRMAHYKVPGVSIALVENGRLKWANGYGTANTETGTAVDANTLFQAASISKPLAALAVLHMVERGMLDLDEDVNTYLKEWKIPENAYTQEHKVTLRGLLTHTAGVTVHGFPGYLQSDRFPTITEVLNGQGNTGKIIVDTIPGSIWRYSGGGYTIMEKIIEDQSGLSLEDYMSKHFFPKLGMANSTFQQPLGTEYKDNASAAYDRDGVIIEGLWHNYPEKAAAGLWTTPTDLAKYCIEIHKTLAGQGNGILSRETVEMMLSKHHNGWGLGPALRWDHDSLIFMHGGKNAGFTNNLTAFANRGNALIIMTNGDNARPLIAEIERAVSKYYGWGFSDQRAVEAIQLTAETLNQFAGTYRMRDLEIGLDFSVVNGRLAAEGEIGRFQFIPLGESTFIDLETGHEIVFQPDGDKQGFLLDNRLRFDKAGS